METTAALLDLDTMEKPKPVDASAEKKEEAKNEETPGDDIEEEKKEEEEGEKKEDDGAADAEKKEGEEESEKKKEGEEEDEVKDLDAVLGEKYKEKYGIENLEDLETTLETLDAISTENEELKKKLEAAETGEPKYKSEKQKKIAEFLQPFDPDKFGEGLQTAAKLMSMDIEKVDGKVALEEAFILDHPELTRSEAARKFQRTFEKKYALKPEDEYETPQAFKEAKEDVDIDIKSDVAKAKKRLTKEQENLKTAEVEQPEAKKENQEVIKSIERNHGEFQKTFKSFESNDEYHLKFKIDEDGTNDLPVKFDKKQVAEIKQVMSDWIKNPISYNAKGEIPGGLNVAEKIKQVSFMLYGEEIVAKAIDHATQVTDIKKVEKIAKTKPDRTSGVAGGGDMKNMNPDQQFEFLAKKKKAERERRVAA